MNIFLCYASFYVTFFVLLEGCTDGGLGSVHFDINIEINIINKILRTHNLKRRDTGKSLVVL
jgi:hypothetical protein